MNERLLILAAERITSWSGLDLPEMVELVQNQKREHEERVAGVYFDMSRDHFRARVADCDLWLAAAKELSAKGKIAP